MYVWITWLLWIIIIIIFFFPRAKSKVRNVRTFLKFCWLKYLFDSPVAEHPMSHMECSYMYYHGEQLYFSFMKTNNNANSLIRRNAMEHYKKHWKKTEVFIFFVSRWEMDAVLSPVNISVQKCSSSFYCFSPLVCFCLVFLFLLKWECSHSKN